MATDPTASRTERERQGRAGEIAAELVAARRHELLRIAAYYMPGAPPEAIEDALQNAVLAFIQAYGCDRDGAWSYLAVAVRTAAWKSRRTHARKGCRHVGLEPGHGGGDGSEAPADPADVAIARAEAAEGRRALVGLPADQRRCLILAAAGYGTGEIAARLKLTERAVRRRIEKARRRLGVAGGGAN
jgi:RNA polymerase sigma factor (sigma-70 family)